MVPSAQGRSQRAPQRVVLLGASNLMRGFPELLACLRTMWPGPLEVLAAHGLGRSYGMTTRVFGRELPGIEACGLWRALDELPPRPTIAVLTDPGNDIAYGAPVEQIEGWIRFAVERLERHGARIVLTRLPLASLEGLSPVRFFFVRTLLFKARPITRADAKAKALALDRRLAALAAGHGLAVVDSESGWYRWDAIHLRARVRCEVWHSWLGALGPPQCGDPRARLPRAERSLVRRLRAERERRFGRELRQVQPALRLDDGSTVALY